MQSILTAIRVSIVTIVLTGLIYPAVTTAVAQITFNRAANGSLVKNDRGVVVGSELLGQRFVHPAYFHPRPSAAGSDGHDGLSSSGSNLGPTSKKLEERASKAVALLTTSNLAAIGPIPVELVTASGSGLDPHLSPQAALWQAGRVAAARKVILGRVTDLVTANIEGRDLGLFGEPRVNVLLLNLALDRKFGPPAGRN